jgi:hypothetical protein
MPGDRLALDAGVGTLWARQAGGLVPAPVLPLPPAAAASFLDAIRIHHAAASMAAVGTVAARLAAVVALAFASG